MRALCWHGKNDLRVEDVPDPEIINPRDAIVRVTLSAACGSDLHAIHGLVPTLEAGDILGQECLGEIVETGPGVQKLRKGQRVSVSSFIACGSCWFCKQKLFASCDNTNQAIELQQPMLGHPTAGRFGYGHAYGGYAGSHAQFVRVPHADVNCFPVPSGISDEAAVFLSDTLPTAWIGAEMCAIQPGQIVAVYGCGGLGLMAQQAARLLGAERVIGIDTYPERLALARQLGSEIVNYAQVETVLEKLQDLCGGRGPDAIIDAVGLEAEGTGSQQAYDRVKQALHLEGDRAEALRSALFSCRKGGIVSVVGFYELMDKFPFSMLLNKGLTLRTSFPQTQACVAQLAECIGAGKIDPSVLVTHRFTLEEAPEAYKTFGDRANGCVRAVFKP